MKKFMKMGCGKNVYITYLIGSWSISSDNSYKGPFELDNEDDGDEYDVEEDDASSINSDSVDDAPELAEESSYEDSIDSESRVSSPSS